MCSPITAGGEAAAQNHALLVIIVFLCSTMSAAHWHTYGSREPPPCCPIFIQRERGRSAYPASPRPPGRNDPGGLPPAVLRKQRGGSHLRTNAANERAPCSGSRIRQKANLSGGIAPPGLSSCCAHFVLGSTQDKEARLSNSLRQRPRSTRKPTIDNDELSRLDPTRIRERFSLIEETTALPSDFRQIEDNFRQPNARAEEQDQQAGQLREKCVR